MDKIRQTVEKFEHIYFPARDSAFARQQHRHYKQSKCQATLRDGIYIFYSFGNTHELNYIL